MKNIKYTLLLALSAAGLLLASVGCQKEMDSELDDRSDDMRSVYELLSRAYEALRASFYVPVETGPATGFTAGGYMMAAYCDEAQEATQSSGVYNWYRGDVSVTKMPLWWNTEYSGTDRWSGFFNCIFRCNEALRYLRDPVAPDYDQTQRDQLMAQAYAVRAYSYLQLIKRWGGVPVLKESLGKDHDYSKDKRASFAQCVDFIIESCDSALRVDATLQWSQRLLNYSNPELSRAALWAIKSQAALYAASPLWADDNAGTKPYTWERAAEITKQALDLCTGHGLALFSDATAFPDESSTGLTAYDKFFLAAYPGSGGWDTETIYQPYNYGQKQSQVWKYAGLPIDDGQVSAGACPTQEMVDAYEVLNADGTESAPLLDLANPYNADGTPNISQKARDFGYVDCSDKMYSNRDPRFYATIYYDGVKIQPGEAEYEVGTYVGGNCGLLLSPTSRRNTCTGYYLRKFNNAQSGIDTGNKDGYMRGFRVAELYLNFAEAAYRAYGADMQVAATQVKETVTENDQTVETINTYGVPMSARDAVNAVRARVGMPALTESGEDFWLRLSNERRVELAFEEHRFFDVRRWTTPGGDLSATDKRVTGMRIEESDGRKSYSRFFFDRQCYTSKYLKYPVSLDEVRKMLGHTGDNWQNDGWN